MVNLRGLSNRGAADIRKLDKQLKSNKLDRQFFSQIKNGDSFREVSNSLSRHGIKATPLTIERRFLAHYSLNTVTKYYDVRRDITGKNLGYGNSIFNRVRLDREIRVQVRGRTSDGRDLVFNTFAKVGENQDLSSVRDNIRELYLDQHNNPNYSFTDIDVI